MWQALWLLMMGLAGQVARADYSDFNSLCQAANRTPEGTQTCERLHRLFFSEGDVKEFAPFSPAQVGAPVLSVDSKVMFLVINDPNYMAGMGYCYFVFRKWISPGKMSPDRFGATVTGFSILNENLSPYQKWIETSPEGKSCKAKVKSESGVVAANLEVSIRGHSAIIVLNPYAFVQDKSMTYAQILKEMVLTTNHERIHAYQVLCPEFEKKAAEAWSALSAKKQAEFRSAHEGYDWDDAKVASREFFAFEFERTPEKIAPLVSAKCRIGDR